MTIYYFMNYLLFFACFVELSNDVKIKRYVIIALGLVYTIFGGFRWETGNDWTQYYYHFLHSNWSNIFHYYRYGQGTTLLEPGFVFLNAFIRYLFDSFCAYNLITLAFIQFTYYKFSVYFSPKRPLLLYCFIMLINPNFFAVRAGLSIAIIMWAYKFVKEQNLKAYLAIVFGAFLIHRQCIALLPIYWFQYIRINFKVASVVFLIFAFVGFAFQEYFETLALLFGGDLGEMAYSYTQHESISYQESSSKVNVVGWSLNFFFMVIYYYFHNKKYIFRDEKWFNCLICTFIMHIAMFMIFKDGMGDLSRLSTLYFPAQAILFSGAMDFFLDARKGRNYRWFAVAFFVAYFLYKLPSHWSGFWFETTCLPYKTIFD